MKPINKKRDLKTQKENKDIIKLSRLSEKVHALIDFKELEKATKLPLNVIKELIKSQWVVNIVEHLPKINFVHDRNIMLNIINLVSLLIKLQHYHGHTGTISKLKAKRLNLQQYCTEQKVLRIPYCASDKDNIDKSMKWLKPNLGNHNEIRYTMSVLRIFDTFKGPIRIDTENITKPSTACSETVTEILKFIKKTNLLKGIKKESGYLPLSNKAGPNGPCTLACLADLSALKKLKNKKVYQAIYMQLKQEISWLNMLGHDEHEGETYDAITIGLQDKFDKTRTISILDFWSNAALSGIHKTFMKALGNLETDVTFRQSKIPELIKLLGSDLFSSDMTAFTDRFLRTLEKAVVAVVYEDTTADRWDTIIADRDFVIRDGSSNPRKIRYEVGNPMGVLSSWPVSTMTHHVIKHFCAYKTGTKNYKYLILGDDTMDSSLTVYLYYINLIKKIGVMISKAKCTISNNGSGEFAKRLFRKGIEVTGIPVNLLTNIVKQPENYIELVRVARERGYGEEDITRGITNLLSCSFKKERMIISDQLALSENITGRSPLLGYRIGSYAEKLNELSHQEQSVYLKIARDKRFFLEANKISFVLSNTDQNFKNKFQIKPNHPLVFAVTQKLEPFMGIDPDYGDATIDWTKVEFDEYSIYTNWCEGKYRNMCRIPTIDGYKYRTKAHRVTKAEYLVYQTMLELSDSENCNDFLYTSKRLSDDSLYNLGMVQLQKSFVDVPFSSNKQVDKAIRESIDETFENLKI